MDLEKYKNKMLDYLHSISSVRDNDGIKEYVKLVKHLTCIQFHVKEEYDQSKSIKRLLIHIANQIN